MVNMRLPFSNKTKLLVSLFLTFSLMGCQGLFSTIADSIDDTDTCDTDTTEVTFKQVAYWIESDPDYFEDIADSDNDIDYSQLTHIIFGYVEVNADGSLDIDDDINDLQTVITDIQSYGVKVIFSIGGEDSSNLQTIAADDDLSDDFINNVVDLVNEYGLDGIDLSWQFPKDDDEGELFEDLVGELSSGLEDEDDDLLLTIEVVSGLDDEEDYADVIPEDVFDGVDFVNIRAFNTNNDENEDDDDDLYLTTDDMLDVIDYWTDRCLIQNKLVVGIPVYGTDSSVDDTEDYADIVEEKSEKSIFACDDDDRASIDGDYYYFNAIPTVYEKTEYAETYAGGVALMSFDQDYITDADYSLLNAIDLAIDGDDTVCD